MTVHVSVQMRIVSDHEAFNTYFTAPTYGGDDMDEERIEAKEGVRVLPLSTSILTPGLSMPISR